MRIQEMLLWSLLRAGYLQWWKMLYAGKNDAAKFCTNNSFSKYLINAIVQSINVKEKHLCTPWCSPIHRSSMCLWKWVVGAECSLQFWPYNTLGLTMRSASSRYFECTANCHTGMHQCFKNSSYHFLMNIINYVLKSTYIFVFIFICSLHSAK